MHSFFAYHRQLSDYINLVTEKLEKLTPHHFISHFQSAYLKQRKENMDNAIALILMDFAENFISYPGWSSGASLDTSKLYSASISLLL